MELLNVGESGKDSQTQLDSTILQTHNDPANTEIPQNKIWKQTYCTWKQKSILSVLVLGITIIIAVGIIIYLLLNNDTQKGIPTVTIQQKSYSVNNGGTIILSCNVSSTTTVTSVTWQKTIDSARTTITSKTNTNKYSGSTPSTPSLTIFNTDSNDAGTYRCFASNCAGSGQSVNTASLFVASNTVPTVQVEKPSYSVFAGIPVTLECTVTSTLSLTNAYWERNITGSIKQIRSTNNTNKYSGSTVDSPSLTIFNTDQNDIGTYTCFATNSVGTGQSTTTTLSVTVTVPVVILTQIYYVAVLTSSVTLGCVVSSSDVTSVSWQRTFNVVVTTITSTTNTSKYSGSIPSTPSLTIYNADLSDAGTYRCFASNSAGTGQSAYTASLDIIPIPVPTVTITQTYYSVISGSSVTLGCIVSSPTPVTSVSWQRTFNVVITTITSTTNTSKYSGSIPSTPSLTIYNADLLNDSGTYRCFASNIAGTGQTVNTVFVSVTSNITAIPKVILTQTSYSVIIGSSVTLGCIVSSTTPVTSVSWQRRFDVVFTTITSTTNTSKYSGSIPSTPSLTIYNADQINDSGTYKCFASNSAGKGQSALTASLYINPIPVPTIIPTQTYYSVMSGSSVTLEVFVSSTTPVTSVSWQKTFNGIFTTIGFTTISIKYSGSTPSTPSLTIYFADSNDSGTYRCLASNSGGTGQSFNTFVSVTSNTVPTVQVEQYLYSVPTGSPVTLLCTVTSTLTVSSVTWRRNIGGIITQITTNTKKYSGSTTDTPSLTIFNAGQSDIGTYTCFATNSLGTGQSSATKLSVTGS